MTATAADDIAAHNRSTLDQALAALSADNFEGHLALCTDDIVLELPYGEAPGRVEGKDAVRQYFAGALAVFKMRLWVTDTYPSVDPDVVVAEYTSEGHVTTTGKSYANTYIGIYRFRDGKIAVIREFYNPVPAVAAMTPD